MKRLLAHVLVVSAVAAVVAIPGPAQAESCVTVPIGTGGFTLEAGGQQVRIPALDDAGVCYEIPGLPGIPWVKAEYGGASVVITAGSGNAGHFTFRYTADGSTRSVPVTIPGTGGGSETCLVGVGSPSARPDCAVKLHADELVPSPLPTVPPIPTVSPGPLPTVPPIPTVEPEPLPTIPPLPDDVCVTGRICLSTLPELIEDLPAIIERLLQTLQERIQEILRDLVVINCGPVFQILGLC